MDKMRTTIGGKNVEVNITAKGTYKFIDKLACDIPDVEDNIITTTPPPTIMPPMPSPAIGVSMPKSALAALLPCDYPGLSPCPQMKIDFQQSRQMTPEELAQSTPLNTLMIPYELNFEPGGIFTGYLYIRPNFENKCCCEAEPVKDDNGNLTGDYEDVVNISVLYYFVFPKIVLPLSVIPWQPGTPCDGSQWCAGISPQTYLADVITGVQVVPVSQGDPSKGSELVVTTSQWAFCCGLFCGFMGNPVQERFPIPCCKPQENIEEPPDSEEDVDSEEDPDGPFAMGDSE